MSNEFEYLNTEEVAKILKVQTGTVRSYIRNYNKNTNALKLKAIKLGKNYLIDKRDLEEFIKSNHE